MSPEQEAATRSLQRALKKCAATGLGVYVFDANVFVCPQPKGRQHPDWNDKPVRVCDEIGTSINVRELDCDGGAGC